MNKYILLFVIISVGKLFSQDWQFVGLDSMVVRQLYVFGDTIWSGTAVYNTYPQTAGLYRSTNKGKDWAQVDTALGDGAIISLNFLGKNQNIIYLVKSAFSYSSIGNLYKSLDTGKSWKEIKVSDREIKFFRISPFDPKKLYATDGDLSYNDVYKSIDEGTTWQLISYFPSSSHGRSVAFNFSQIRDSTLFALVNTDYEQYFYKSTDDGYSWRNMGRPPVVPPEILTDNKSECRIYAESYFITDDCGLSWFNSDSIDINNRSFYRSMYIDTVFSKLYLLKTNGLFISDKNNINWMMIQGSQSLPMEEFGSANVGRSNNLIVNYKDHKILVGTGRGIYVSDLITSIDDNKIFQNFALFQNYPNPFNNTTKIKYSLPHLSFVTIKIYDMLGKEIQTLINQEQYEGNYEIQFDAADYSTGIYIYSIKAGSFTANQKMILLK